VIFLPMRLLILATAAAIALPTMSDAAPKKLKPAVPAVPAAPSVSEGKAKPAVALIESDLDGRELTFLSRAIEFGKTFSYLASQAARTANPALRAFDDDLVKTLAAQNAVLGTVAEMRKVKIPDAPDAAEQRLAAKLEKLQGIRLEKALLDAFRETDRHGLATYEMGAQSEDLTIRQLCEQTLPKIRKHLAIIEAMTGIAPKQQPDKVAPQPGR
jgi:Domain of unknown function (DUF4142)